MSNPIKPATLLEALPDELFLHEFFPMFSFAELWNSFANLNERMNGLLKSLKHLQCRVDDTNDQDPALQLFAPSVGKLTVRSGQLDIQPFQELRSLTLEYPNVEQRNIIRLGNFPWLEYLDLSYPMDDVELLQSIFSGELKRLKTCKLGEMLPSLSWTGSPQLRSLTTNLHGPWELICVLRACPNLVRFNAVVSSSSSSNFIPPNYSVSCLNVALRILTICTHFDILVPLLTTCPNLERLTFWEFHNKDENNHLKLLAKALLNLGKLSYVRCHIRNDLQEEPVRLHPLFRHFECSTEEYILVFSE